RRAPRCRSRRSDARRRRHRGDRSLALLMRWVVPLAVWCACSAPATLSELSTAERRADAGDYDGAIAAYHEAQGRCGHLRPVRRARAACADALLGEAEVDERAGRTKAAIDAYLAI